MAITTLESPDDAASIDTLLDIGFGANRGGLTVYRLRQGDPVPGLSLVRRTDCGRVISTIRFWHVDAGGGLEGVLLGPLAVCPDHQGKGHGKSLIAEGLTRARLGGWSLCFVVGDASYYQPFGFTPAEQYGFYLPGPVDSARFQVKTLSESSITMLQSRTPRLITAKSPNRRCLRQCANTANLNAERYLKVI